MNAKMQYEKKRTLKQVSFNLESYEDFKALETANDLDFSVWVKEKLREMKKHKNEMVYELMKKCGTECNMFRMGAIACAHNENEKSKDLMDIPEFAAGYYAMMGYKSAIMGNQK